MKSAPMQMAKVTYEVIVGPFSSINSLVASCQRCCIVCVPRYIGRRHVVNKVYRVELTGTQISINTFVKVLDLTPVENEDLKTGE